MINSWQWRRGGEWDGGRGMSQLLVWPALLACLHGQCLWAIDPSAHQINQYGLVILPSIPFIKFPTIHWNVLATHCNCHNAFWSPAYWCVVKCSMLFGTLPVSWTCEINSLLFCCNPRTELTPYPNLSSTTTLQVTNEIFFWKWSVDVCGLQPVFDF